MITRTSSGAFVMAILVWPAFALGWIPGGLPSTAITSVVCLSVSYFCYRVLRVRRDAEQIAQLTAMRERDGLSDEEMLSYVPLHHPNLNRFGTSLATSIDARKHEKSRDELVTLFPWMSWSDTDTADTKQMIMTVFDKEPSALDSNEADFLLEMLETKREDKGGMFLTVAKSIAKGLERTGGVSMDPGERDAYGRKRLPEIAREIGLAREVIDELGWDWPTRRQRPG